MYDKVTTEKIWFGLGLILIFCGLILNEWLLVALFSADGTIEASARLAIRVFELFIIIAGLFLIAYRKKINLSENQQRIILVIFIAGIILRVVVYIFLQPNNNDPHLEVIEFIIKHGALPASDQLVMSFHPPLYYLLATPFALVGSTKFVQFFSLLLSLANFSLLYFLIKGTNILQNFSTRCHALILAAILPQFVLFSSFISNDSLAFLVGTGLFLLAFRYIEFPTGRNLLLIGLVMGLALLTKGSFISWIPVFLLMITIVEMKEQKSVVNVMKRLGLFSLITIAIGSYKYIENTIKIGHPVFQAEDAPELHYWVDKQSGTYQGINSLIDFNIIKLLKHPYLSEYSRHSIPLLLYGTFWYSHIKESNFNFTRSYPWTLIPRAIYFWGLVPTGLMVLGTLTWVWKPRLAWRDWNLSESEFKMVVQQWFVILIFFATLALILLWGFKHDAWSFFQARLLFPAFFSIMVLFGKGYERITSRPAKLIVDGSLLILYALIGAYYLVETGNCVL